MEEGLNWTYQQFLENTGTEGNYDVNVPFEILSTIRYDPLLTSKPPTSYTDIHKDNFFLFPEHIERLKLTYSFFLKLRPDAKDVEFDAGFIFTQLVKAFADSSAPLDKAFKIRLLVALDATVRIELYEVPTRANLLDGLEDSFPDANRYDVYVDLTPVLASPFTSFKTTNRGIYTEARQRGLPGNSPKEEVILINTANEVMEGSITSIAVRSKSGDWVTPKLTSGCLCGVTRHLLLKRNMIKEGDLSSDVLREGQDVLLMNGVMGCVRGTIRGFVGQKV